MDMRVVYVFTIYIRISMGAFCFLVCKNNYKCISYICIRIYVYDMPIEFLDQYEYIRRIYIYINIFILQLL